MQNRYPLWKNLMLIIIAVIGFIYAIPNLYSEDPAVQISSQSPVDMQQLSQQVAALLDKAKLNYRSITTSNDRLEIRFASTDTQLLAQDIIKNGMGSQYTVALNLAPATPKWLSQIGAEPMKQGLDLRGGVHFLLEVDVDSVISRRFEGLMKGIGQELREAGIRYTGIRYIADKGIDVSFRTEEAMSDGFLEVKEKFPNLMLSK